MASEWTVDTLHAHLTAILDERQTAISAALAAAQLAVDTAEKNAEKWRDSANEWRGAMDDREVRFVNRAENDALLKAINDRLTVSETWRAKATGAALVLMLFSGLIGAALFKAFGG